MSATFYPLVQEIYVAYYGRPADPAGLQYWAGQLAANRGNLASIINAFGNSAESTALYAGATNAAKVTAIYQQLFNRAPDTPGLNYYTAELTAGRMTAASIALNVADGATGTDLTFLNNKITVAQAFTDALITDSAANLAYSGATATTAARALITGVTTSAATTNVASTITSIKAGGGGGSVAGQTFTLTTDADNFTGTSGNDIFNARADGLFDDGDIIDGGAGVDRLNFRLDAADQTIYATDVTNVETVYVRVDTTGNFTFDLDENDDITAVWVERNAQTTGDAITLSNLVEGTDVGIQDGNGNVDLFIVQADAGLDGASSDVQTLRVNGASIDVVDIDNVETINLISQGSTSTLAELSAGTADTVTITASGDVTVTLLSVDEDAAVNIAGSSRVTITNVGEAITLNAAGSTGAVTLRGLNEAEAYSVTGGSGNDVFEATGGTALATGDAINGGAGTDLLIVDFDVTAANSFAGITNVERLQFIVGTAANAGQEAAFDMDRITAISSVEIGERTLSTTADLDMAITNFRSGTTVVVGDTDLDELDITADESTAARLNLTVNANTTAGTDITVNTIEVGQIAIISADPGTADIGTSGSANDITISDTNNTVTTVTLAATVATSLVVNEATGVESVNASASTSAVTITVGRAAEISVTGGSGNDTIAFGVNLDDNDVVDGGGGNDTLSFTVNGYSDNINAVNIETITVTDQTAATTNSSIDLSNVNAVTLNLVQNGTGTGGEGNTITFESIESTVTTVILDANADAVTACDSVVLDLDTDTSADAITIRLDLDGTRFGGETGTEHAITANDFETVNLTVYLDNSADAAQGYTATFGDVSLTDATNVTITLSLDTTSGSAGEVNTAADVVLHIDNLDLASVATVDLDAWTLTHIGIEGAAVTADLSDADILAALAVTSTAGAAVGDYGITFNTADAVTVLLGDQRDNEFTSLAFGSGNTGRDVIRFTNSSEDSSNDIGLVVIGNAVGTAGNVTRKTVIDLSAFGVADLSELTITAGGDSAAGIAITSADDDFGGVIILVGLNESGINGDNFIFSS
jgi:hypothetical protein